MERKLLKIHDYKDIGVVKIADSVIEIVASIATMEVDGVKAMAGTTTEGIAEMIGKKKSLKKGVKVVTDGKQVSLTISIIVDFGVNIVELTDKITEKVSSTIEIMTGLKVAELNINVEGVDLDK